MTKTYSGSLLEDCASLVALGEQLKNPVKPKRAKDKPCRCEAYSFPHRRYSKACKEASAFFREPWQPRVFGSPVGYPFPSEAAEHNHFFEKDR